MKMEKLLDLLHHADITFRYWDGKRRGVVERDLTAAERQLLIRALRRTSTLSSQHQAQGE
jgi:hypothetical protein